MKKITVFIVTLISILLLRSLAVFLISEKMIQDYHHGKYDESLITILYPLNLNLSYKDYYNHGNILYQKKDYSRAISKYEEALKKHPTKKDVCDIRINLALSILANSESKARFKEARLVLYQDDCAHEFDDLGRSEEAEKLEQEIKNMEEQNEDPDDPTPSNPTNPNNPNDPNMEQQIIQQIIQNNQNRYHEIEEWNNMNNYEYYSGKPW